MKRQTDRKHTAAYMKAHPKWTPERKAKFQATMAAKKASERTYVQINHLAKLDEKPAVNSHFVEHFVGVFSTQTKETKKAILCSIVAKL